MCARTRLKCALHHLYLCTGRECNPHDFAVHSTNCRCRGKEPRRAHPSHDRPSCWGQDDVLQTSTRPPPPLHNPPMSAPFAPFTSNKHMLTRRKDGARRLNRSDTISFATSAQLNPCSYDRLAGLLWLHNAFDMSDQRWWFPDHSSPAHYAPPSHAGQSVTITQCSTERHNLRAKFLISSYGHYQFPGASPPLRVCRPWFMSERADFLWL